MSKIATCAICAKSFKKRGQDKTCSIKCRRVWRKQCNDARRVRTIVCPVCQNPFRASAEYWLTCSEGCRQERKKKRCRDWVRVKRATDETFRQKQLLRDRERRSQRQGGWYAQWKQNNPEAYERLRKKRQLYMERKRAENPEKYREYYRRHKEKNREKYRESAIRSQRKRKVLIATAKQLGLHTLIEGEL